MLSKRLIVLILFAALAVMPAGMLRAQWVRCYGSGPWGGSVSALGVMGPYAIAGTGGGGIFRTTDNGESWNLVCKTNSSIGGVTVSGSKVFAASDNLYVSTDSGITWSIVSSLPANVQAGTLVVFDSVIVYGSFNGLYISTDLGLTWEGGDILFVTSLLDKDGVLFAGVSSTGLYRSNDSGVTWTQVDKNGILNGASPLSLAYNGNDIFAGGDFQEGFFRSTDNGITWDSSNIGMPYSVALGVHGHCTIISLYQDGINLYAGTAEGLFISSDSGSNWRVVLNGEIGSIDRSGANILVGSSSTGISLSSDTGVTWNFIDSGFINSSIDALGSIGSHIFADISGNGIYRSDDSGVTWIAANNGLTSTGISEFTTIDTTLFALIGSELFKTTDLGGHWDSLSNKIPSPIATIGSSLICGGYLLSSDEGVTWDNRGATIGCTSLISKGTDMYANGSGGDCDNVFRSSDSGRTWTYMDLGLACTLIYSLGSDGNYIFAGTGQGANASCEGILRGSTSDSGLTTDNNGPTGMSNATIGAIATQNGNVFIGSQNEGVFQSSDDGNSWNSASEGLTYSSIQQLLIVPPYVYAGTYSAGIWRRALSDFAISTVSQTPAIKFEIQSYPNPFTQSTQISFTSESAGYADISIVNLLGELVARIFSGELGAGEHSFEWDAGGLPAGMYECVVRAGIEFQRIPVLHY
jgi:hypothetical protein